MATLILTAVGTAVGGPLGGAIGALLGRSVDQRLFGQARQGPRLKELDVQTSTYGTAIARLYGRMRVAGSVIWSTDLVEHREKRSGGKGQPKVVQYGYSVSLAIALSSRPIQAIGRIWADGKLLRGAAGDFKTPCVMRIHHGHEDQPLDPLIAQAEGADGSSAFRGIAYVVLEDLDLADYGNRIPLLTFEVLADDGPVSITAICRDCADGQLIEGDKEDSSAALCGFAAEAGSVASLIDSLSAIAPMQVVERNGRVFINAGQNGPSPEPVLPSPIIAAGSDPDRSSLTRRGMEMPGTIATLRFYQTERDFQPGLVRARLGNPVPGAVLMDQELPAAMDSAQAQALVDRSAQRSRAGQSARSHRCAAIGPDLLPGNWLVDPADHSRWLVQGFEWSADGCVLNLMPAPVHAQAALFVPEPGRAISQADLVNGPSLLALFDLPLLPGAAPDAVAIAAAATSSAPGWKGAALHQQLPDGDLEPLGLSARHPALLGSVIAAPLLARPGLIDWASSVDIALQGGDTDQLINASLVQLAQGRNLAMLGEELIQFSRAEPLGQGQWRLTGLLRGLAGTEPAIAGHAVGEPFVLLGDDLVLLPATLVTDGGPLAVAALGLADAEPVRASLARTGRARQPMAPVHPQLSVVPPGESAGAMVQIGWQRRARGQWSWSDSPDLPLVEERELYRVALLWQDQLLAEQIVDRPVIAWDAATWHSLMTDATPSGLHPLRISIRQIGTHGISPSLVAALPLIDDI